MEYCIPHKRELTEKEVLLLEYLLDISEPELKGSIKDLKVIARCGCGKCPTVLFGKSFSDEVQRGGEIVTRLGQGASGNPIDVVLFGTSEMPTELEFFSLDGTDIIEIPEISTLRRMV